MLDRPSVISIRRPFSVLSSNLYEIWKWSRSRTRPDFLQSPFSMGRTRHRSLNHAPNNRLLGRIFSLQVVPVAAQISEGSTVQPELLTLRVARNFWQPLPASLEPLCLRIYEPLHG
jgi:hypothetical protein